MGYFLWQSKFNWRSGFPLINMSGVKLKAVIENKNRTWPHLEIQAVTVSRVPQLYEHDTDINPQAFLTLTDDSARFLCCCWCQFGPLQLHVWWHRRVLRAAVQPGRTSGVVRSDQMITMCPSHPSVQTLRRRCQPTLRRTFSYICFVFPAMTLLSFQIPPALQLPQPELAPAYLHTCPHFSDQPCSIHTCPFPFSHCQIVYSVRLSVSENVWAQTTLIWRGKGVEEGGFRSRDLQFRPKAPNGSALFLTELCVISSSGLGRRCGPVYMSAKNPRILWAQYHFPVCPCQRAAACNQPWVRTSQPVWSLSRLWNASTRGGADSHFLWKSIPTHLV